MGTQEQKSFPLLYWILDPFTGSSTTGIAASLLARRFLGLDQDEEFLELSKKRREEIEDITIRYDYKNRIYRYSNKPIKDILEFHSETPYFGIDLPIEQIVLFY